MFVSAFEGGLWGVRDTFVLGQSRVCTNQFHCEHERIYFDKEHFWQVSTGAFAKNSSEETTKVRLVLCLTFV